ncbi:MAG TPA: hypothetical protein VJZ71_01755 [Phycisphaerae bacterium]|nr:hypothetical protein [Phycisphaerae bacterium]
MRSVLFLSALVLSAGLTTVARAQPLTIVSNEPGTFIDISGTGNVLVLNDDQEAVINPGIGNAVFPVGSVVVANNGGLAFPSVGGQNDLTPTNHPIPSVNAFNGRQSLLAYWDDLEGDDFAALPRGGKNGSVYWEIINTVILVVQWEVRVILGSGANRVNETVTFQIQIFGGATAAPGAIYAQLVYADVEQPTPNGGASATIGYQNGGAGFNNVQWSFNTAGAVNNGKVLTLRQANSIPAVSDAGNVALILLFLAAGIFVFRRGRRLSFAG